MRIYDRGMRVPAPDLRGNLIEQLRACISDRVGASCTPIRLAVTRTNASHWWCDVGVAEGEPLESLPSDGVFAFHSCGAARTVKFNVAMIVPTGVGAEIGGHSGDAGAAARLLAQVADVLITHPNVMNAADINELPENGLYVEGSVLTGMLMGVLGLEPARANRILVVLDNHPNHISLDGLINAVNCGRASYGLSCSSIVVVDPPLEVIANYTAAGRSSGEIRELLPLLHHLKSRRSDYDAIAVATRVDVPAEVKQKYFASEGKMVNPWGGVEALLTHTMSAYLGVPTAHSPMWEGTLHDPGIVDPRIAAEAVSFTAFQSVLKGLQKSPRIVERGAIDRQDVLTARDVACLVVPRGCLGLPTLAALSQGITVIEVQENANLMKNDLSILPWAEGQFYSVNNYWEAAGLLAALRAGIHPSSVRRPVQKVRIENLRIDSKRRAKRSNIN